MFHISSIHEKDLTPFHRDIYMVSVNDLSDTSIFRGKDYNNHTYFSIEMYKRLFSKASKETLANLLLTTLQIKGQKGNNRFLLVFNDGNVKESMDILNGLVRLFKLVPSSDEQKKQHISLSGYAGDWTRILLEEEKGLSRIGVLLKQ